jgi:anti-sigma regulatory factor (Ser/Thr protein kinase)
LFAIGIGYATDMAASESELGLSELNRPKLLPDGVEDNEEFKTHSAIGVQTVDFREFAPSPEGVGEVRAFVREVLEDLNMDEDCIFQSQLVADELATNAMKHAGSIYSVAIEVTERVVRVAVRDDSSVLPTPQAPPLESTCGRGLSIVSSTANRWGTVPLGLGKEMWADVPHRRSIPRFEVNSA